jgi:hypothetical protein
MSKIILRPDGMAHIFIVEFERVPGGFGLGVMLSYDGFKGFSLLLGWWQFNMGLRLLGL